MSFEYTPYFTSVVFDSLAVGKCIQILVCKLNASPPSQTKDCTSHIESLDNDSKRQHLWNVPKPRSVAKPENIVENCYHYGHKFIV